MDWSSDFRDLIDSVMADEATIMDPSRLLPFHHDQEVWNSTSTDVMMMTDVVDQEYPECDDSKGSRLVHLLMAAAEALTGADQSRELTRVILARLKELVSPSDRTNMERLAAHFTDGLSWLLERPSNAVNRRHNGPRQHHDVHDQVDLVAAFQLLQDMSPYVNFGYLTANQAILEAVGYERRVHIVDYDIMEGVQWASFMQALVSRKQNGPPMQHLHITALSRTVNGGKSVATVKETKRRLTAFAESIGQPFSFHHCKLRSDEMFSTSSLKLAEGEALVINCMLHLPRFSYQTPDSLITFLSEAKTLDPKLVTLVHEEVGMCGDQGVMGRFMDLVHQFSAMFDSLEAGLPMSNPARGFIERVFLSPWIGAWLKHIVAVEEDGEVESFSSWSRWLESNGFNSVEVSFASRCQAKLLLSIFGDGYNVEELGRNGLVLAWKSRRLVSASFWASPQPDL